MSLFAENLEVLRSRFPVTAARVAGEKKAAAAGGLPAEAARRVARWWLGDRVWERGALLAVSGWGEGAHVRLLLEAADASVTVFVAEPDAGVLRDSLAREDWRELLADRRLLLGVGALDEGFFSALESLDVLRVKDVEALVFAPCYNQQPAYFGRFFMEFARQVDVRRKLYGTAVVDAELWMTNSFDNLERVICAPDVAALRGVFSGVAMLLVSAGPSLDESLEFLREMQDRALIVAVNSSYRALRHAGIVPHLVLAADPRGHTALGFRGVPTDRTWLVTTPLVSPEVPALFDGRVYAWSGSNTLACEIRRRLGVAPGTSLIEQGTVSACAVDLAVLLGCPKLCLVGQDLAAAPDGRSHAKDSFYSDLNANRVDQARCRMLPGNTLKQVAVEEKLYVYLKTFEAIAASRPGLRMINTSRLGARIRGVPYASFKDAKTWLGGDALPDVFGKLASRALAGGGYALDPAAVRRVLQPTLRWSREVLRRALGLLTDLERLFDGPAPEASLREAAPAGLTERFDALWRFVEGQGGDYAIFEAGRFRLARYRAGEAVDRLGKGAEARERQIRAIREEAWAVAEGAWFLLERLQAAGVAAAAEPDADGHPGGE
ncbi:MAG: DUF115 domain-containing protein [Verrucomicrobia bacterium]|nr:MAG: DUF115 domain-containing protein [Verrucomicrobiota bacterium]